MLDGAQLMSVGVSVGGEDADVVELVDAHRARGVDYLAVAKAQPDVHDVAALGIVEKCQIARGGLLYKTHRSANVDLLRSIAGNLQTCNFIDYLRETRAVDAIETAAAPEVWRVEERECDFVYRRHLFA